jgi:diguanylate cyclase (GGDEF)-like protein
VVRSDLNLDNFTLQLTDALVNLTCGLMLLAIWTSQGRDKCFAYWGAGMVIYGTMNCVTPYLGEKPGFIVATFSILKIADVMFWAGYRSFDSKQAVNKVLVALPFLPATSFGIAFLIFRDQNLAVNAAIIVYCAIALAQVIYVVERASGLMTPRAISGLVVLLNISVLLVTTLISNELSQATATTIFLATDHFVSIVFTMSIIAMVSRRDYDQTLWTAHHDTLTGALNRRGLAEAIRSGVAPKAVLLIDLDRFKQISDTYGHYCGDEVLKDFVVRVKALVSEDELLVRMGGEEFLLTSLKPAKSKIEELAHSVLNCARAKPTTVAENVIPFTVSVGLAYVGSSETVERAVTRADSALYLAKSQGRNRIETSPLLNQT